MKLFRSHDKPGAGPHPGEAAATVMDGAAAVVHVERCAGTAPALPAAENGAASRAALLWQRGATDVPSRIMPVECTDEATAIATAAGLAESGLRATAIVSGSGLTRAGQTLAGAAAKHLPLVVHVIDQALQHAGGSDLAGHDAALASLGSGWFQLAAWDAQSAADLSLVARRLAEQLLLPGMVLQEAWLTSHRAMDVRLPTPAAISAFLGTAGDRVPAATPDQKILFGEHRRRVPEILNVDCAMLGGAVHGENSYAESVAARQVFTHAAVPAAAAAVFAEYAAATRHSIAPLIAEQCEDAHYLIVTQGSAFVTARAIVRHLRKTTGLRVGAVNLALLRPMPEAALGALLLRRRAVLVLERQTRMLAAAPPLLAALRATLAKTLEHGRWREATALTEFPRAKRVEDLPVLYGASYGLGGRELQPSDVLAVIERMTAKLPPTEDLVLGVEYVPRGSRGPMHEMFAEQLQDAFPTLRERGIREAPGPSLLPADAVTIRVFAPAGREPFGPDDHPGTTLHALGGLSIAAWPDPARHRRESVSAFTLVAARAPLEAWAAPAAAEVTVATDAAVLGSPRLVRSLGQGTSLVVLLEDAAGAGAELALAAPLLALIRERGVDVYALPAGVIGPQAGRDAESQALALRRFVEGALLGLPSISALTALDEAHLATALNAVLVARDPGASADDIEAALALMRLGAQSLRKVPIANAGVAAVPDACPTAAIRPELRTLPAAAVPVADLHRHWQSHPQFRYGDDVPAATADPFVDAGVLPAATGLLHDVSPARGLLPHWMAERCTGCGACWSICPDSALSALVNTPAEVLETGVRLLESAGEAVDHLPRAVRVLDGSWRARLRAAGAGTAANTSLRAAAEDAFGAVKALPEEQDALRGEMMALATALEAFPLALTDAFFIAPEAARERGGLLSITLDPDHCKGCGACVQVCPEQALEQRRQTPEGLASLRREWAVWHMLPNTAEAFSRLGENRAAPPGLETLLLDKQASRAVVGGDDADPGSAANTILRLFSAVAESVLRPRFEAHASYLETLIARLEAHIRERLAVDLSDVEAFEDLLGETGDADLSVAELWRRMDRDETAIDTPWLRRAIRTLAGLRQLRRSYRPAAGERPRAALMVVAATGAGAEALTAYPFNPFAYPWSNQPPEAAAGALIGVARGHLERMAAGFRLVRSAELELGAGYRPQIHDPFFARFGWREFSEEEWKLCPALVLMADGAVLRGTGAGQLLALLRCGIPLQLLCLDDQSYQPLASLPGTLPAFGDDAGPDVGATNPGAALPGPSIALLAAIQGTAFVAQSSLADRGALLDAFRRGLSSSRAALFNVFKPAPAAPGQTDYTAVAQSTLALRARAHPSLRFDPGAGGTLQERLTLGANPEPHLPWPSHALEHLDAAGRRDSRQTALTYAHFALAVPSLAHHFRRFHDETETAEPLLALEEYLELDDDERREYRPFVWATDPRGRLQRWLVSGALVETSRQRLRQWRLLRALTREDVLPVDEEAIAKLAREEVVETVWRNLMALAESGDDSLGDALTALAGPAGARTEDGERG